MAIIRVRSKLKVQNSSTFQGLSRTQTAFSSTKIIDKKPYPRRGHSKFRLQCDTEVYCTVLTNTVMTEASDRFSTKLSTNAKFQNLQDLNSRFFKYFQASYLFSSTFKGLEVFIPNSNIFKDFSSTL